MKNKEFSDVKKSTIDAIYDAQKIAFAPVVFQATRLLKKYGILEYIEKKGASGARPNEISDATGISIYGVSVLLETGLSADLVKLKDDYFFLTKTGYVIIHDEMTSVNFDFIHDVCYEGLFHLDESIKCEKPAGLKVFGKWATVYEALSKLPENVKESWFNFDHFYSDSAFPAALPHIFADKPAKIMDIGANTGKFSIQMLQYNSNVSVTVLDLPGQLEMAMANFEKHKIAHRVTPFPLNILDRNIDFPAEHDAIWMSQFLVCFSKDEVTHILKRAAKALSKKGFVYILDTFWDKQKHDAAAFCLINTSPYFTTIANGNSKMYQSSEIVECAKNAGLALDHEYENLGISHTLLKFRQSISE